MDDPEVEDITCWGGIQLPNPFKPEQEGGEDNASD